MAPMTSASARIVPLLAVAYLAASVAGHGWLQTPLARQFCNGKQKEWSVSISAGNGARGIRPPSWGGVPGLCGDPFEGNVKKHPPSKFHSLPCEPQKTYTEGSTILIEVDIAAHHGGFFEFRVCDQKKISENCFKKWHLTSPKTGSKQWHMLSKKRTNVNNSNPERVFLKMKLPDGLTCKHCVLQWTWWTAHNCVLPCKKSVCGFYADKKNLVVYPNGMKVGFCDSKFPKKGAPPQMYKNCADFAIVPK